MHKFYAIVSVGEKSKKSIPLRADIRLKCYDICDVIRRSIQQTPHRMIFAMLFVCRTILYRNEHT